MKPNASYIRTLFEKEPLENCDYVRLVEEIQAKCICAINWENTEGNNPDSIPHFWQFINGQKDMAKSILEIMGKYGGMLCKIRFLLSLLDR